MFLSKIQLKRFAYKNTALLKSLSNPDGEHRILWDFFGDKRNRERDFIYRKLLNFRSPNFVVLSERKPKNPDSRTWEVRSKLFQPKLTKEMALQFSLRANATIKKDGSYHDVVMNYKYELEHEKGVPRKEWPAQSVIEYEAGFEWLKKRDSKNGFQINKNAFRIQRHETIRFEKDESGRTIHLGVLDMTGLLKVLNVEKFLNTLHKGLGRSKTYGCGLMLVKLP